MTTKITEQNISNISNAAVQWQTVVTADGSTATSAVAGYGYFIDTTSAAHTVNLPNTASVGDTIILKDYTGTWGTNNVTISSTLKISGADADGTLSTNNTTITIVYMDTTKGWTPIQNSTQSALATDAAYVTATGGTITTSGDYKTHVFTGDGCFVVSCGGNSDGSNTIEYLVVGGGGAGGTGEGESAGGGGAGGFRSYTALPCASPLNAPAALPVSVQTYPVTVGAGGSSESHLGPIRPGSNSIFSTITSAGGGAGKPGYSPVCGIPGYGAIPNMNGGSGGGGTGNNPPGGAGTGNTPPVSPPQGQPGGDGNLVAGHRSGGGGGGAGAAGQNGVNPLTGGDGGAGSFVPNAFFGPVSGCYGETGPAGRYFSGGGGGMWQNPGGTPGDPGLGGGGESAPGTSPGVATAGTANTGGGGGAGYHNCIGSGTGGKGIVVIRYKFQ